MKWWTSWVVLFAVLLGGCNPKPLAAPDAKSGVSESQVREWLGVQESPKVELWVAYSYPTIEKGISPELMDAIARPEFPDAEWRSDASLRDRLKKELLGWNRVNPDTSREINEVANNIVMVINGQILASHIATSEGNWPGAIESGLLALDTAWRGLTTAPDLIGNDLQLSLWMAADNLARLSNSPQITQIQRKEMVAKLDEIRGLITRKVEDLVQRDFSTSGVSRLTELLSSGADPATIGAFVAPMDDPNIRTEKLSAYFNSVTDPFDAKLTVISLGEAIGELQQLSHGLHDFSMLVSSSWAMAKEKWRIDVFSTASENWELTNLNTKSQNPAGEMIKMEILRKYFSALESSYVSETNLAAAMIRVGTNWFVTENGRFPKDMREMNLALGTKAQNIFGGAYDVDWKNSKIHLEWGSEDRPEELILLNAIVESGVSF